MSDKKTVVKRVAKVSKRVEKNNGGNDTAKEDNSEIMHASPISAEKAVDLTGQIAKRAYELYEERGRQEGLSVQDWGQAEREIRKDVYAHRKMS